MKAIENKLEKHPEFVRCHRSYIINTNYIDSITGNSKQQYLSLSHSNKIVPISRSLDIQIIKQLEAVVIGDQGQRSLEPVQNRPSLLTLNLTKTKISSFKIITK